MKRLFICLLLGFGLIYSSCCYGIDYIKASPMKIVLTDRNFVNTLTVKTEEGVYRIFIIEGTNGGGTGITAVKIK